MNYFTYTSQRFTPHGRDELNKLTSLPMCGFISIAPVSQRSRVRIPLKPWFFSGFFFPVAYIGKLTPMIILHFHLQPQCKYELFPVNFTSFLCTGRYELNKLTSLLMCGFVAQLVEHRTGIAEVTGSNPVEALIFFRLLLSSQLKLENLLRWSHFTFIYNRSTNMNYFI